MNLNQALRQARQDVHTVSGNWYAGQCYSSNKAAKAVRENDVITRAVYLVTGVDSMLIDCFTTASLTEGHTRQVDRAEWVLDHTLSH